MGEKVSASEIRKRIYTVLSGAGKPMDFERIYKELEADGQPLPPDKPKLIVRKILYGTSGFAPAGKGLFIVADGATPDNLTSASAGASADPEKKAKSDLAKIMEMKRANMISRAAEPRKKKPSGGGMASLGDGVASLFAAKKKPAPSVKRPVKKKVAKKSSAPEVKVPASEIRARIFDILQEAGNPMDFDKVYAKIESDGKPLPSDKPKLVVRKILSGSDIFESDGKGAFQIKEGAVRPVVASVPVDVTVVSPVSTPSTPPPAKVPVVAPPPPKTSPKPVEKKVDQKVAAPAAAKVSASEIRARIFDVLKEEAKPMDFNKIYTKIEADGKPLPADKPKLVVRKVLYGSDIFDSSGKGLFQVKDGAMRPVAVDVPVVSPPVVAPVSAPPPPPPVAKVSAPVENPPVVPVLKVAPAEKENISTEDAVKAVAVAAAREAIAAAKEAATIAAKEAADAARAEAADIAMVSAAEAAKMAAADVVEAEAAKEAAIAQARQAAREAAREVAKQATLDAAREAAVDEAKHAAIEAAKQIAVDAAREIARQEVAKREATETATAVLLAEQAAAEETQRREAAEAARQIAVDAATKAEAEAAEATQRMALAEAAKKEAAEAAAKAEAEAAEETQRRIAAEAAAAAQREAAAEAARQAQTAYDADANATSQLPPPEEPAPTPDPSVAPVTTSAPATIPDNPSTAPAPSASGKSSIRERIVAVIEIAGQPMNLSDIYSGLKDDEYPLPKNDAKNVVKKILGNSRIFISLDDGTYAPNYDSGE